MLVGIHLKIRTFNNIIHTYMCCYATAPKQVKYKKKMAMSNGSHWLNMQVTGLLAIYRSYI